MNSPGVEQIPVDQIVDGLRRAGARFGFLHGSRAAGTAGPGSDIDVAAYFGSTPDLLAVLGETGDDVDVLVLDDAPLELAGRVAMYGQLLFEADPAERVEWVATTRKIYLDELPRIEQARRDFLQAHSSG